MFVQTHNGLLITGVKVSGNNTTNGAGVNGITLASGANLGLITGNMVSQGSGLHHYGISIAAGANNNIVTNNDLRSSGSTGGLSDAGTGTITTAGNVT